MYRIGIDVGSTYTKYCIMDGEGICSLFMEKTPIRQNDYFEEKLGELKDEYPDAKIISCGYGKRNVPGTESINELTALARGCFYITHEDGAILDIGGQDTKVITQKDGRLKEFFINDKCAAGSGMFLSATLDMLGIGFKDIDLSGNVGEQVKLSSTCAVFAQSEIVELIADNATEEQILSAVLAQILAKSKPLLGKISTNRSLLSGGFSQISGISGFASDILGLECLAAEKGAYLAAIGCAAQG